MTLLLLEGAIALLLSFPQRLPASGFLRNGVRSVYLREDWSVPQADLEVMAWDPELTYLLRPRAYPFVNREFDTILEGNSAGLRDDEASLESPAIIVLGDSYSLGWGVERDEAFAQVLERRTGLRVLNASMSSYGTARQVILLERLDTMATRAVVVQYFLNDFEENRAFVENGFSLATASKEDFEGFARQFQRQSRYRPLDYLRAFLDRSPFFPELESASTEQVAEACLKVLESSEELEELPIFFLQIDPWADPHYLSYNVLGAMAELLATDEYADLADRVEIVDLDNALSAADFFILDPHLRPRGHEKIAAELERALSGAGLLEAAGAISEP